MTRWQGVSRRSTIAVPTICVALAVGIIPLLVNLFCWTIIEVVGDLIMLLLDLILALPLLGIIVLLIRRVVTGRHQVGVGLLLVAFDMVALFAAAYVPSTMLPILIDFKLRQHQREAAVQGVESGALKPNIPNQPGVIHLPSSYAFVSSDEKIEVEKQGNATVIIFYVDPELNGWSGFVYRSDANEPLGVGDEPARLYITPIEPHWFWINE